ncbi:phage major capsid protein [Rhodosalinus sp. K401]|uniref:phage major capsid protein n=1 Tax=Rhodosalinus sp. K401 TaxID=3239195 RepID=UPI0035241FC9
MLESVKIQRRQSEVRQALAELAGAEALTDEARAKIDALDKEYGDNERKLRAALIAEEEERRAAGQELETRDGREWADMLAGFEMRQVALALDEGRVLEGQTAEIVQELREKGGYRGVPVPWEALEQRVGETVASGTPDPVMTRPIIDRLFPQSVAARLGGQMIQIASGQAEWPVTTSAVSAGWADGETGTVAGPTVYATTDRNLSPDQTLGITMKITRKAMKQSGAALEQAVRRDMAGAIAAELDKAAFLGAGSAGEPLGVIAGAGTYGLTSTAIDATATWGAFRDAIVRFMTANAVSAPSGVRLLIRPETYAVLDGEWFDTGSGVTEWDRLVKNVPAGNIAMSANALAAPSGSPAAATALLTTNSGGVAPFFIGTWGAVDLIRDPYSDATSGGLRLTALATVDITVARPAQLEVLTGIQAAT